MDHVLIVNWNEVVHPDDHVWVVGDFCADRSGLADLYLDQLNGSKSLVIGDRDTVTVRRAQGWEYVDWFTRILLDEQWACLSHFPLQRPPVANGTLNLFAHSQEALCGKRWSCDIGLERWDYRPTCLAEISQRLGIFVPFGSHPRSSPFGR